MPLRLIGRLLTIEALRALARNKMRSGLAMLGVSVAVATVIIVVALGRAGVQAAERDLDMLGDNLVWVEAGSRTVNGARSGTHGMTTLTAADARAIREEVPKIALVSEQVDGGVLVVNAEHNWLTRFRGVSPDYQQIKRWQMAEGEFFTQDHVDRAVRVLVIGETVRRQLFGDERAVGEIIRAGNGLYEVVGVLAPKGTSATGQDQDDTVMLPWTTARARLIGKEQTWLDDILCSAVSADEIKPAGAQISELLRERHRIAPGADDDFNIRHPEELLEARIKSSRTLQALFLIMASIAMAVGGIGVMNVMLASVSQRITEIGVRAAIGARPAAIRLQFLAEAVMLTALGGVVGLVLGELVSEAAQAKLGWTLAMSNDIRMLSVLAAVGMGLVFGYYPAARAAQLDPVTAIARE